MSGWHDLGHEIEIANVPCQHCVSTLECMQIDGGIVQRGHLLARLKPTKPEHQSSNDSRLQKGACTDGILQPMAWDFPDHRGEFVQVLTRAWMPGIETSEIV